MDFFNKIIFLEEVDSTNNYLKKNNCDDKTIVYTFNQTQGRGRLDRKWLSFENKNLALSILFKPDFKINNTNWFIATTSIALINTLLNYGINNSWIKWPNDIYIENKKISGILAESTWNNLTIEKLIVGIGVNINSDKNDLIKINKKTTSIYIEKNKLINIEEFTNSFIKELSNIFNIYFEENGINFIKTKYLEYSKIIGKKVEWIFNNEIIIGEVDDIDIDGYLILKINKQTKKIIAGDINLII